MNNKFLSNLGLAMRAGKVVTGEDGVLGAIKSGDAKLVIVAGDASDGTRKKINDKCVYYRVPIMEYGTREQLGGSIGKEQRALIAVTDAGFAQMLAKAQQSSGGAND